MWLKFRFFILVLLLTIAGCNTDGEGNTAEVTTTGSSSDVGYQVTGRIMVASNTAKDSDVNDPRAPALSENNSLSSAQRIPNPVILGGYVNQPGAGPSGRSKTIGDIEDYFAVELRRGQLINLFVAEENLQGNDLDLTLFNSAGQLENISLSEGATESLIVPTDGAFMVRVNAYLGASSYVLSIGQNVPASTQSLLRLSDEFEPYEVLVKFKPEQRLQAQSALGMLGLQSESEDTSRRMLLTLEPNQSRLLATEELIFAAPEMQAKYETLMTVKQLRHRSDIEEASPNYTFKALRLPNDTLYRYQWNLPMMNLPLAWDLTTGDNLVVVAVVDTGVLLNHPDLKGQFVDGYDFIRNLRYSLDGDGLDNYPDDPGDQSPNGSTFHGTHVAGLIAAQSNNNNGIAGIGWQTRIMPLRVLGKGGAGSDYDIEQAIRFAAGLANDSGTLPTHRADVINLSLGGPEISSEFQELMNEARRAGVIVVAASGNDGTDTLIYPASLTGVVSVGAVDINQKRASYSNYGPLVDVMAPGGDNTPDVNGDGVPDGIISAVGNEMEESSGKVKIEYTFASSVGTSMASPQIAGVLALMKAVYPDLTPQNFDNLLSSGKITDDLGTAGLDDSYGYGLLNAHKSVLESIQLSGGMVPTPTPKLVVTPNSLNFGLNNSNLILTLSNGGGSELQIANVSDNAGGFLKIQGSGLGDYTVNVDRRLLSFGTYTATITITTNANSATIPVILQVGDPNVKGDAGLHYILLVNPETWESVQQAQVNAANGRYDFRFNNVRAGNYIVVAGSDINNDNFICDIGEACGAYLVVRNPSPITVNGNMTLAEFGTGFNVSFLSKAALGDSLPVSGIPRIQLLEKTVAP